MFGFLIGTACLIGLMATMRRGFHGHHGGGCGSAYAGGCGSAYAGGCGSAYAGGCGARGFDGQGGCGPRAFPGHHGCGGYDGSSPAERGGGRGFRGFRGFGPRAWLATISARLDLTPGQEKVFRQAFDEVRETMRKQRGELGETRKDVARAFRAASFDAVLMGDVFGRHDGKLEELRKAAIGALAKVHEALDERQRELLASMLEEGWW